MTAHETMLDDVAVYALGSLSPEEAQRVRAHLAACDECRNEYEELRAAAGAIAYSAESCPDLEHGVVVASPLLKTRIMEQIRRDVAAPKHNVGEMRAVRPIVWPAYAVAAACLVIALVTGIVNLSLNEQMRQTRTELSQIDSENHRLLQELAHQRTAFADLVSPDSQRYGVDHGQVVRHGKRLYLAMEALPAPPKGKVYQAWTLRSGASRMSPSVTFVPDSGGVAFVPIPGDARSLTAVAVSVEPEGGSKQPTSTPTFVLKFS